MDEVFDKRPQMYYTLSPEQMSLYEQNGYLVIKQLFDNDCLHTYRQRFNQVCNGEVDKGIIGILKDAALIKPEAKPEEYVNKIQDLHFDEVFVTYTENPLLLNLVSQFLKSKHITCMNSTVINKPPGTNEHLAHQDLIYLPIRPADKIICAYTAIDYAEKDNGCVYVVPGTHRRSTLYDHSTTLNGEKKKLFVGLNEELAPEADRVYLELSPGDTIFFHPLIIHGSGSNKTKKYRKSILCHYASAETHYIDVAGTVQEPIAKEIEAVAAKRGISGSFHAIWRFKSKDITANSKL